MPGLSLICSDNAKFIQVGWNPSNQKIFRPIFPKCFIHSLAMNNGTIFKKNLSNVTMFYQIIQMFSVNKESACNSQKNAREMIESGFAPHTNYLKKITKFVISF